METKEYYKTGKPFCPAYGETYENLNGTTYRCISRANETNDATMQNAKQSYGVRWTFRAHGIRRYADGRIDWEHSTDGSFETAVD